MPRQPHRGRSMLSKCSGIGKCIHVDSFYNSILVCSKPDADLHLVSGRRCNKRFLPGINKLCGFSRFPCNQRRIHFSNRGLFCAKSAPDSRLDDPDFRLRYIKSRCQNTAHMKGNLSGRHHIQPSISVQVRVGAESLHHGLLVCLCMIGSVQHIITGNQHTLNISLPILLMGTEISLIVGTHRKKAFPIILRVN